ncbi:class I SAM-dependent methyltransferase [Pseudalkalibacillus berkeleyi]|uniref:Methyltransferase domain-containing protein n=1 Tax=Pseudalkalibacillus berkeleyi TaxID=1069813 RepID=A0ABS9H5M2_9BACL|nr:methyltransferase domain-containing protein [Pseudalkalibacillus berkeleyi]MCF6139391.1 methyltransferase domain-containing protein [Pseudalkalibacillus berkeleyi]
MSDKRFNPELAEKLFSDERKKLLPPDEIISSIEINKGDVIADLGAGNGYFTVPFAKASQKVFALDIEPKMLDLLKEYADQENTSNIEYVVSGVEEINIDSDKVDLAFIAFVIHEVEHIEKALSEVKRILKPDGKLVVLEWKPLENPKMGPPSHERISSEKLSDILNRNGFRSSIILENEKTYGLSASLT